MLENTFNIFILKQFIQSLLFHRIFIHLRAHCMFTLEMNLKSCAPKVYEQTPLIYSCLRSIHYSMLRNLLNSAVLEVKAKSKYRAFASIKIIGHILGYFQFSKIAQLVYSKSSEHLERKALAFFATFKQYDKSKNDSNIICTSAKKQQIS